MYATLTCTHFVEAQKIIKEGNRRFINNPDEIKLELLEGDSEGLLIHEQEVDCIVYSGKLWEDTAALMAIMREDNLDAEVAKEEGELDAFGMCHYLIKTRVAGLQPQEKIVLTSAEVT